MCRSVRPSQGGGHEISHREWIAAHGYPFAAFVIGLSTAVFLVGRSHVVTGQWGVLYLLIVVVVAGASGTGPAVLAAVLSFFAWDSSSSLPTAH